LTTVVLGGADVYITIEMKNIYLLPVNLTNNNQNCIMLPSPFFANFALLKIINNE